MHEYKATSKHDHIAIHNRQSYCPAVVAAAEHSLKQSLALKIRNQMM